MNHEQAQNSISSQQSNKASKLSMVNTNGSSNNFLFPSSWSLIKVVSVNDQTIFTIVQEYKSTAQEYKSTAQK